MASLRTIAALLSVSTAFHSANAADLTIKVTSPAEPGIVRVALYNDPATFLNLNKAVAGGSATPKDGAATFKMAGLAPGRYAVSAFLDTNGNQKLDTNSFGVPQEPVGMSRDAKGKNGPPSFEDAAFIISDSDLDIAIQLKK